MSYKAEKEGRGDMQLSTYALDDMLLVLRTEATDEDTNRGDEQPA